MNYEKIGIVISLLSFSAWLIVYATTMDNNIQYLTNNHKELKSKVDRIDIEISSIAMKNNGLNTELDYNTSYIENNLDAIEKLKDELKKYNSNFNNSFKKLSENIQMSGERR